jgi:hypothetical protein
LTATKLNHEVRQKLAVIFVYKILFLGRFAICLVLRSRAIVSEVSLSRNHPWAVKREISAGAMQWAIHI